MSSIYKPKDKKNWYVGFIDPETGEPRNLSTHLRANKENKKKALEIQKKIDEYVDKKKKEYADLPFRKKTIKEGFDSFKNINSDKKANTIYGYDSFYKKFGEFIDPNKPITAINKELADEWLMVIKGLKKQKNTIYNYYKVFNKFLNFLFEYEYIPVFIINKNVKPKQEIKAILTFKENDQKIIMESLEEKKEIKEKNSGGVDSNNKHIDDRKKNSNFRTMIYMQHYTGLRPTDIINITVDAIDLGAPVPEISYHSQKTDQYFTVPIQEVLVPILQARINEVKEGRIFNYSSVGEMGKAFRRYLKVIGLDKKGYNLRTFRKTFTTNAFEKGISIVSIAALLGHSNVSTTMKYYTKVNRRKLAEELSKLNT